MAARPWCGCPGLFRGAVPLPLPVDCDTCHVALGALWAAVPGLRHVGPAVFVLYQAVEDLLDRPVHGFLRDVAHFTVGYVTALAVCSVVASHCAGRGP